ncbi:hypothetical protein D3C87_1257360 [compost metagenome]
MATENFNDHTRTIQNGNARSAFQIAQLRRRKVTVKDHDLSAFFLRRAAFEVFFAFVFFKLVVVTFKFYIFREFKCCFVFFLNHHGADNAGAASPFCEVF